MRSDIHDIGIQRLKPSDSWIVIFGHKRPKEPIFPPSEYIICLKQTSMRGTRCLYPVFMVRLGPPWTCDFLYCASCLLVYVDQCST